jgi:transposase
MWDLCKLIWWAFIDLLKMGQPFIFTCSNETPDAQHILGDHAGVVVPDSGPIISTAMVAAIGTRDAFERGRDFGAWLGLGNIAPAARPYWPASPGAGANMCARFSSRLRMSFSCARRNWERFSFDLWLTNAATRMHRNKLAAALANKLARIAWSVLRHQTRFDEALAPSNGLRSHEVRD